MTSPSTDLATFPAIRRQTATTLQLNLGRLCNQACRHCHVDASPAHTGLTENAQGDTVEAALELLRRTPLIDTLDVTGGAPELNPHFRELTRTARSIGRRVLVRHNLTVQFEAAQDDLPGFFADQGVVLVCSLPCYLEDNVDRQRGRGVFDKSLDALRRLNAAGFGTTAGLELHLVYNPQGPSLPPPQQPLEADYRRVLRDEYGIHFTSLCTITNQPIHRFRQDLERAGKLEEYFELLQQSFNPATLDGLMCRTMISVRWDGQLFDCDFNLVQGLVMRDADGRPWTLRRLLTQGADALTALQIQVDRHCFACTAGSGSSCGGALTD